MLSLRKAFGFRLASNLFAALPLPEAQPQRLAPDDGKPKAFRKGSGKAAGLFGCGLYCAVFLAVDLP